MTDMLQVVYLVEIRRADGDDRIDHALAFTNEDAAVECFEYLLGLGEPDGVGASLATVAIPLDPLREEWAPPTNTTPYYLKDEGG